MIEELREYTGGGVHEEVLNCFASLPKGTVLDVPSGQGALSKSLEALGFKVFCGDIEKENMIYRNSRCIQLDLNNFLPFRERIFDYVVCVEGIEHIENPHHLIREFAEVTKKGGYALISTPNVMTIKSRLRFLFYSYLDFFRYFGPLPLKERHQIRDYDHQHLNPLSYPEIRFILEKYGFQIQRIVTNRNVKKWGMIHPVLKRFIKYKTSRKFPEDKFLASETLLEGETLICLSKRM